MKRTKKLAALTLAAAIAFGGVVTYNFSNINADIKTSYNLNDAKSVLKMALGITKSDISYDLNKNGKVDLPDAQLCLKYALGILKVPTDGQNNSQTEKPSETFTPPNPTIPPNEFDIDEIEKEEDAVFPYNLYETVVYNGYFGYFYNEEDENKAVDEVCRATYVYDDETNLPVVPRKLTDEFDKYNMECIEANPGATSDEIDYYCLSRLVSEDVMNKALFSVRFCGNPILNSSKNANYGRTYHQTDVYYCTEFELGTLDMGEWKTNEFGEEKKDIKFKYYEPVIFPEATYDEIPEDNPYTREAAQTKDYEWLESIRYDDGRSEGHEYKETSLKFDIKNGTVIDADGSVYNLYELGWYHGFWGYFRMKKGYNEYYAIGSDGKWEPCDTLNLWQIWQEENPGYDFPALVSYGGMVGYVYDGVLDEGLANFEYEKAYWYEFVAMGLPTEDFNQADCIGTVRNYQTYFDTEKHPDWGYYSTWDKYWYFNDYNKVFKIDLQERRLVSEAVEEIAQKNIEDRGYIWRS